MPGSLTRRALPALLAWGLLAAPPSAEAAPGAVLVATDPGGIILHGEAIDRSFKAASLVKVMTAFLVFDALKSGTLSLSQHIPVSANAAAQSPVKLGLPAGSSLTVDEALQALIVLSANDIAVALAEAVAGSEPAFVARMNDKARALGLNATSYANPSGLPGPGQATTARDQARLVVALRKSHPAFFDRFGRYSGSAGGRSFPHHNAFLGGFPGADGIKTGFTCEAGYTLLGSAERDGQRLVGVVLGARSSAERTATLGRRMAAAFDGRIPESARSLFAAPEIGAGPADLSGSIPVCRGESGPGLSGWGLAVGFETKRRDAVALAAKEARRLRTGGRAGALRSRAGGRIRYQAVIGNLKEATAVATCQNLRKAQAWCVTLPPDTLETAVEQDALFAALAGRAR